MRLNTRHAGAIALAAMLGFTIAGANGSGALAQDSLTGTGTSEQASAPSDKQPAPGDGGPRFVSEPVVEPLPGERQDGDAAPGDADTLKELVAQIETDNDLSSDMRCLAGAIYFEARGEALLGQLAVGRVVVNRAESGRFPSSYCGVVYQPGQFSFARGGHMPRIDTGSGAWRTAKAIARIAHEGLWESPVRGALYFHATYVKPRWGRTELAQVDHHIFYR